MSRKVIPAEGNGTCFAPFWGSTWDVFHSVLSSELKSACNVAPTRHHTVDETNSARVVQFSKFKKCQEKLYWRKHGTCFAPFWARSIGDMFRSLLGWESNTVCNVAPTQHDTTNKTNLARIVEFSWFKNVRKSCIAWKHLGHLLHRSKL